jgi:membrane protein implicated in regulation of membrane protease activity
MDMLMGLYESHPFWVWAGLGALLLAVEVASGSGWLLWPAASAFAVGVVALLVPGLSLTAGLLMFAILTLTSTLLARRYLPASVMGRGGDINDNVARLVGHHGQASENFADGQGRVMVDGKEWAAELVDGGVLEAGARVTVTAIDGVRLKVQAAR